MTDDELRALLDRYDTQMEVERNPFGAWGAIQSLAAEVLRLGAKEAAGVKLAEAAKAVSGYGTMRWKEWEKQFPELSAAILAENRKYDPDLALVWSDYMAAALSAWEAANDPAGGCRADDRRGPVGRAVEGDCRMGDAMIPERIWVNFKEANRLDVAYDEPPATDYADCRDEYLRADLHAARIAELERQLAEAREVKPEHAETLAKEMQAIVAADRWKGRDLSAAPPEKWNHLRPETRQFWIETAARILSALKAHHDPAGGGK